MVIPRLHAKIVLAAVSAVPGLALGVAAWAHFTDGVAVDGAIPVPAYMVAEIPVPAIAYHDAVAALQNADRKNGEAIAARAEAAILGGQPAVREIPVLQDALARSPAAARSWVLLAEVWLPADKPRAVAALGQALLLAPNDFWLVGRRAKLVAQLWPYLDAETRAQGLSQVRMLWEVPVLRPQIRALLKTKSGAALLSMALADKPQELREMNRWLLRTSFELRG